MHALIKVLVPVHEADFVLLAMPVMAGEGSSEAWIIINEVCTVESDSFDVISDE